MPISLEVIHTGMHRGCIRGNPDGWLIELFHGLVKTRLLLLSEGLFYLLRALLGVIACLFLDALSHLPERLLNNLAVVANIALRFLYKFPKVHRERNRFFDRS